MRVRSLEDSARRYFQHCLRAYFEGKSGCNLPWILGVIGPAKAETRAILEANRHLAETEKYRDLMAAL